MANMTIEICPESGICSIIRENGAKIDLMPDEVDAIREALPDQAQMEAVISENDSAFAAQLTRDELVYIGQRLL